MAYDADLILVVDDDENIRGMLALALGDDGYRVETAGSAAEMLDRVAAEAPDLILLDVVLPGQDGVEALQVLRERSPTISPPVILMTGTLASAERAHGIRSGAVDYVTKPFDLDELLARIRLRLDESRQIRAQRRAAVNASLQAMGRVAASERLEDVATRITSLCVELLDAAAAGLLLWNAEEQVFLPVASTGLDAEAETTFRSLQISAGASPALDGLISREAPFLGDGDSPNSAIRRLLALSGVEATLTAPVVHARVLYGMLVVGRRRGVRGFGEEDIALLDSLAKQAGLALSSLQMIERLEREALTDGLTGLGNARAVRDALSRRLSVDYTAERWVALLMLDLDHFKNVNDRYGHPTGDRVLSAVAGVVRACTRAGDVVGRYGGDEFAVILANTELDDAVFVAERIVERVRQLRVPAGEAEVSVTLSAGVAVVDGRNDPRGLLVAADRALYEAKMAGRDCVRAWAHAV